MPSEVAVHLVALALQKLEALQVNETQVLTDEKCLERAEEVAAAALQSVAVCTKVLLSRDAEAQIPGLGLFHLKNDQIQFVPDSDVVQFTLLKRREVAKLQLSLRNAVVTTLLQLKKLVPMLDFSSAESANTSVALEDDYLIAAIFGTQRENDFGRTVSVLLNQITEQLQAAGVHIQIAEGRSQSAVPVEALLVAPSDPELQEALAKATKRVRWRKFGEPEAELRQNIGEETAG